MQAAEESYSITYQNQNLVSLQTDAKNQAGGNRYPAIRTSTKPPEQTPTSTYQGQGGQNPHWHGWGLPGKGQSYDECGTFKSMDACLNIIAHKGEHEGKGYFKPCILSCKRPECPTCTKKWSGRQANRMMRRVSQFKTSLKIIHVVISPPPSAREQSYNDLKKKMRQVAKKVGIVASYEIFHPFRLDCDNCGKDRDYCQCGTNNFYWNNSPHFHLLALGWIKGDQVAIEHKKSQYIVKNLGLRDSVVGTVAYLLDHAGVHTPDSNYNCKIHGQDKHACLLASKYPFPNGCNCEVTGIEAKHNTITYSGLWSYNKLRVDKQIMAEKQICPLCEGELKQAKFTMYEIDYDSEFDRNGEYFLDPEGWEYVKDLYKQQEPKHQPASFEDLKVIDA